jgi:hypothetical protein
MGCHFGGTRIARDCLPVLGHRGCSGSRDTARSSDSTGLNCVILGRFSDPGDRRALPNLKRLAEYGQIRIMSWYDGDEDNRETFHFKAASADRGKLGYLGSANMIRSSLRSRMELGVLLRGSPAEELDAVLQVVLAIAKPI